MNIIKVSVQFIAILLLPHKCSSFKNTLEKELIKYNNLSPIPVVMQETLIIAEDRRFYNHCGFDIISIFRALYKSIFLNKPEGGSTLEQQIVRIITSYKEKTIKRKLQEILLATFVDDIIGKKNIPSFYLSINYYGWQMNSFKQACDRLAIDPDQISLCKACEIIAMLKYPRPQHTSMIRERQIQQRAYYIQKMYELKQNRNECEKNDIHNAGVLRKIKKPIY
jgi:membrane peptidoglycan carboxypeptidase